MNAHQRMAKILRAKPEDFFAFDQKMTPHALTSGAVEKVIQLNDQRVEEFFKANNLKKSITAEELSGFLESKVGKIERALFHYFGRPDFARRDTLNKFINTARNLVPNHSGRFIKKEVAKEMVLRTPPPNLLRYFGYNSARELVAKEDIYEIYALLRVIEEREWMNSEFIRNYDRITPLDFEEREIQIIVLQDKWRELFRDFVEKKYHNLSHLKELGVVFILPLNPDGEGFWLRVFGLLIHYLYEIKFYSQLFERSMASPQFHEHFKSALRGDVVSVEKLPELAAKKQPAVAIIQRYLAKENKDDPRLSFPHINPEAVHWEHVEDSLADFSRQMPGFGLEQFRGLDFVGDFYRSEREGENLVSFDLIDNIMMLVQQKELAKYLYHHQEALWNKLFKEYWGNERFSKLLLENFEKGYIIVE